MRTRILELEDEIAQQRPTKRTRATIATTSAVDAPEASTSTARPSAASTKAEEKKHKMQIKKIFDRWGLDCCPCEVRY